MTADRVQNPDLCITCGHSASQHKNQTGECQVKGCMCAYFYHPKPPEQ